MFAYIPPQLISRIYAEVIFDPNTITRSELSSDVSNKTANQAKNMDELSFGGGAYLEIITVGI